MKLKPLHIGDLTIPVPIIQGGMGVGISLSSLAGAVAKEGAIGVISAAQPGFLSNDFLTNTVETNLKSLAYHIKKAKEISKQLNKTISDIKIKLYRIRKKLKEELK